jgi:DNA-binding CsgD family transcriptional regulator
VEGSEDDLQRGRDAFARSEWATAYELLSGADPSDLRASDIEGLADAAWWISRLDESISIRQRAYAAYVAERDDLGAAAVAARLCVEHSIRGDFAVGAGFLSKAHRHAAAFPDHVGQGYLASLEATMARFRGDLEGSLELARRASEIGRRFDERDLIALAMETEGLALIGLGRVPEGLGLLDEAMSSILAGEVTPYFTGIIYCGVIDACLGVNDLRRAGEWSDAATRWCDALPADTPYPAMCRVNRAEVARLRGAWPEAEAEATRASEELMAWTPGAAGPAFYQLGEIHRRRGQAAAAADAYTRAHQLGTDPQPGLALLRLSQGKIEQARAALRVALEGPHEVPSRARLAAAAAEAAIADGDLDDARERVEELESIALESGAPAYESLAAGAAGALLLARGDAAAATDRLRRAHAMWRDLKLPYEAARAQLQLGRALLAMGDDDDAALELKAALGVFEELGAEPDATEVRRLLGGTTQMPNGLSAREAQVLRLVAAGKTNRDIAVELVISEHTVARHLQNIFGKIDVSSRSAATAFAFEHGLV